MSLVNYLDTKFYPHFGDCWDDKMFRNLIKSKIEPHHSVLDLGAGRGAKSEMDFSGQARFVAGVDPDPAVLENPFVDDAKVMTPPDYEIPYPDESFDLVFSNSVLEHIENPQIFFAEASRVLKPGGCFLAKTPNRWHYVAVLASLTPHWFHQFYNRLRGRERVDTFPTVYACNTKQQLSAYGESSGLGVAELRIVEGRPEYLRIFGLPYLFGIIYEKLVNGFRDLEGYRCVLLAEFKKREC